jgi:hypothetical protein
MPKGGHYLRLLPEQARVVARRDGHAVTSLAAAEDSFQPLALTSAALQRDAHRAKGHARGDRNKLP